MLDLELTQACLELGDFGTQHLCATDLLLVVILTLAVAVALDALTTYRPLSVASLGSVSAMIARQTCRESWTDPSRRTGAYHLSLSAAEACLSALQSVCSLHCDKRSRRNVGCSKVVDEG